MSQHHPESSGRSKAGLTPRIFPVALVLILVLVARPRFGAAQSVPDPGKPQIDCYATIKMYPTLHCTCAGPHSTPSCGGSGSATSKIPTLTTKQMMQQQIAATVVSSFMNMLFSNDQQATAQKQRMLAELQARQAEAARQQQLAEAARLAAICQRLQGTLKLSGTLRLQLKSDTAAGAAGGLQLKLGDPNDQHAGVPSLPGIALNDNTGNGGTKPYGIAGLPGIYTNGPATAATPPSGDPQPATGGLKLKVGSDSSTTQAMQATPVPTDATEGTPAPDPRTMTPQQLADLVQNLTPEQQQQLSNALQSAQSGQTGPAVAVAPAAPATHISPTTTVSAAPAPTTTEAPPNAQPANGQISVGMNQAPGGNSPAFGQLQGTAASSLKAANANTLEGAAAGAREGFDTAAGAAVPSQVSSSGSSPATGSAQASSGNTTSASNATVPFQSGSTHKPVVDVAVLSPPPAFTTTNVNNASKVKPSCVTKTEHKLPTRDELITELAQRRTELANLRQSILRLNRSMQMDQKQFADWQAEAEAGYDRVVNRVLSLPTKFAMDTFIEMYEERFKRAQDMKVLTEKGMKQWNMLKRAKELKSFDDFQKWVLEDKSEIETYEEGIRQLIAALPVSGEVQSYANCAADLIDNAYDYVDLMSTWKNVNQLDRNSNQFLTAVQGNGERMKTLVTRIQQIETQLKGVPQDVQVPYCSK